MTELTPLPGRALIRMVQTEETLPGGRIILTDPVRQAIALQQGELVAVGESPPDLVEDEYPHHAELTRLESGAWLLLRSRSWMETDVPGLYVIRQQDILATMEVSV